MSAKKKTVKLADLKFNETPCLASIQEHARSILDEIIKKKGKSKRDEMLAIKLSVVRAALILTDEHQVALLGKLVGQYLPR